MMGIVIVRVFMLAAATGAGMAFGPPLGIPATNWWLGGAGFLFGVLAVLLEWQARRIPVDRIFWGAMGGIVGLGLGLGLGTAMGAVSPDAGPLGRGLFGLLFSYLGASVALAKRDELEDMSAKLFPKTAARRDLAPHGPAAPYDPDHFACRPAALSINNKTGQAPCRMSIGGVLGVGL